MSPPPFSSPTTPAATTPASATPAATTPGSATPAAPTAASAASPWQRTQGTQQHGLRLPPAMDVGVRGLVTVLVPAKDEEAGIGATLRSVPHATLAAMGFGSEVIVLDGHSKDRTRDIAREAGAQVVTQELHGKGTALREAQPWVRGDYVVMIDADYTYPADCIPRMVAELASGEADIVMGSRLRGWAAPGAMSRFNRLGNRGLSLMASVLYLRRCSDVCTGLWGFRGKVFRELPLRSQGFELEVEMFGRAAREHYRVREVPVDYLPRRGGTKLSRVRDGFRIGWCLVRTRFLAPGRLRPGAPGAGNGRGHSG